MKLIKKTLTDPDFDALASINYPSMVLIDDLCKETDPIISNFLMSEEGLSMSICDKINDEGDQLYVVQDMKKEQRSCYLIVNKSLRSDRTSNALILKTLIIDRKVVNKDFMEWIIRRLLRYNERGTNDIFVVANKCKRVTFSMNNDELKEGIVTEFAEFIIGIFNSFDYTDYIYIEDAYKASDMYCT